jgi:hypothetical protein
MQVAVGQRLLVQPDERLVIEHLLDQALILGLAAISPDHLVWMRGARDLVNPLVHGRRHRHPPASRLHCSTERSGLLPVRMARLMARPW